MRTLAAVALNDLRIIFGNRAVWFFVLIYPALFIVVLGLATGAGIRLIRGDDRLLLDVIDRDSSELSRQFVAQLQAVDSNLVVCPAARQECPASFTDEAVQQRLREGATQALIEIPAGFEMNLLDGKVTTVVYRSNNNDPTRPEPLLIAAQAVMRRVGGAAVASRLAVDVTQESDSLEFSGDTDRAAFQKSVYERAARLWETQPGRIAYIETLNITDSLMENGFGQSMPGMGIYAVMANVGQGLLAIINERKLGTLQRLATMPVRRAQILGGKLLAYFLMGMLAFLVSFVIGALLGVDLRGQWLPALLVMIAFTGCFTALTFLLAAFLKTEETGRGVSSLLVLVMAVLGGAFMPIEVVPDWLRAVGHISPVAWAMDGFKSLIFYGGDLASVIVPILVLLAMTTAFFLVAVARFRVE